MKFYVDINRILKWKWRNKIFFRFFILVSAVTFRSFTTRAQQVVFFGGKRRFFPVSRTRLIACEMAFMEYIL